MSAETAKREKIVYGYVRTIEHEENNIEIPDSIKKLCALFLTLYYDLKFSWDPNRGGFEKDTTINGTKLTFTPEVPHFRKVLSNQIISIEDRYSKYEWEIILIDWDKEKYGPWCHLYIGYIDITKLSPFIIRYDKSLCENYQRPEQALAIHKKNNGLRYNTKSNGWKASDLKFEFHEGDRFKVIFDCKTMNTTFYHNDQEIEILHEFKFADKIRPAVSLYRCEIECSVFRGFIC